MKYSPKITLLAVALFGASALAAPFADEAGFEVEAREVDNELYTREFEDMSLDARDIESNFEIEAREFDEDLEAREPASASLSNSPPSTPLSPKTPKTAQLSTSQKDKSGSKPNIHLTPHQKSVYRAKIRATKAFADPKVYRVALKDKDNKYHRFAVDKYLKKPKHLKNALADKKSPFHKDARRVVHQRKAKVYLKDKKNYKNALTHNRHKYHKDAVKKYFAKGDNFKDALSRKKSRFHKDAVREYLLDPKTRKSVLSDPSDPFFKSAKRLQKKIDRRQRHHKASNSDSTT